jgi:hypothetical protein
MPMGRAVAFSLTRRAEWGVATLRLFERFPDVRLAGDVPMNDGMGLFSPAELRVAWGAAS